MKTLIVATATIFLLSFSTFNEVWTDIKYFDMTIKTMEDWPYVDGRPWVPYPQCH